MAVTDQAVTPIPPGARLTASVCCLRQAMSPRGQRRIVQRKHAGREQRRIDGAGLADGQCPDRHTGRHLDDGIEANRRRTAPWIRSGTPNTGSSVSEAVMPGRCAAPPAPAMMTLKPAALAPLAKANSRSGVRCAETMRFSQSTPSAASVSAAWRMVSQSDWLPMMMAIGRGHAVNSFRESKNIGRIIGSA